MALYEQTEHWVVAMRIPACQKDYVFSFFIHDDIALLFLKNY